MKKEEEFPIEEVEEVVIDIREKFNKKDKENP